MYCKDFIYRLVNTSQIAIILTATALIRYKMSSYRYRKSHCGDKTILRPSYLHNGISYTGKTSLYWIGALVIYSLSRKTSYR